MGKRRVNGGSKAHAAMSHAICTVPVLLYGAGIAAILRFHLGPFPPTSLPIAHLPALPIPAAASPPQDLSGLAVKLGSTAWRQLATGAAASRSLRRLTTAAAALQHPDAAATTAAEQGGRLAAALPSLAFVAQEVSRLRHVAPNAGGGSSSSAAAGAGAVCSGGGSSSAGVGAAEAAESQQRQAGTVAAAAEAVEATTLAGGAAASGITVTVVRGGAGSYLTVRSSTALDGLRRLVLDGVVDGAALVLNQELLKEEEDRALLGSGWLAPGLRRPGQAAADTATAVERVLLPRLLAPLSGLRLLHLVSPVNAAPALSAFTVRVHGWGARGSGERRSREQASCLFGRVEERSANHIPQTLLWRKYSRRK